MSDEEKPLDLRDKIALDIINSLIVGNPSFHRTKESSSYTYTNDDHIGTAQSLINGFSSTHKPSKNDAVEKMENIARTAYKMADIIRKVRLSSFE